jgi:hypothetical protein
VYSEGEFERGAFSVAKRRLLRFPREDENENVFHPPSPEVAVVALLKGRRKRYPKEAFGENSDKTRRKRRKRQA